MDTSETYIKMCDWAKIQELADFELQEDGLWFWNILDWVEYTEEMDKKKERPIWLPRQDQSQAMVGGWVLSLLDAFHTFCMWDEQFEELRDKMLPISMEQLWLAFVMKEKYNKVWVKDKWEG